jgi:signal transduction histidine kinase
MAQEADAIMKEFPSWNASPSCGIGLSVILSLTFEGACALMAETYSSTPLECPNCGGMVPSGQQYCPECGVDLILYTDVLFRQRLEEALTPTPTAPASVEELIPRLGDSLVAQKLISPEQLHTALDLQAKNRNEGATSPRLGQILIDMGILSSVQLDRAIAMMVVQLQKALQIANRNLEERVRERTAELSQAFERLSELNQLKANFVANVSHELRTPMTHIVGYLDLLDDNTFGPLNPDQHETLETIRRASQRLNDLIEDLIQFADTSRGGISLNLQPMSLRDAVQEAMARLLSKAQKSNVRIDVQMPSELPSVNADYRRVAWVMQQIIDNGIKFTPAGGCVTIRAGEAADRVWVTVTDTGIGIPQSRLTELFQPFHQLDGSPTRRQGGTGIGLSLCKIIVEAHGSTMNVQSEEGRGSTFLFDLAVSHSKAAESTPKASVPDDQSLKG